jgi:prepilin-type N-terminal cleavage/methylation domain-containing protein
MLLKKGFTLIELLVVISIIGVLVAVAVAGYSGAQIKARDARRRSDMKSIQATMEQYYATTNSVYAAVATVYSPAPIPLDPKSPGSSYNTANVAATGYCICALLEETGKGNANAPTSASCATTWNSTGNYFCVQNQQ